MDATIVEIFAGLPSQGPGTDRDTRDLLDRVRAGLPAEPRIADLGCGTGRSTLALARALSRATITAVDLLPAFIDVLKRDVAHLGLGPRVRPEVGDMLSPGNAPGSLDLIWSEGAAYAVGFEAALRAWRPLLRSEGRCVVSECEWLSEDRPEQVAAFWREGYPAMGDRRENTRRAEAAGFEVLDARVLSEDGWSTYHDALVGAAEARRNEVPSFADHVQREVAVRRMGEDSFGYTFYVLQPR